MSIVFLNGKYLPVADAHVSVMDRGFLFADGVYEVVPVYHGRVFRLEAHLKRLQHSVEAIKLPMHIELGTWKKIFETLLEKNQTGAVSSMIYLQITRGAYEKRLHAFPEHTKPTVFVQLSPLPQHSIDELTKGFSVITCPDTRWEHCHIKSISLLDNVLNSQRAHDVGANEAILFRDGKLTEGASSNVFIIKDNTIHTPPVDVSYFGRDHTRVDFGISCAASINV